MTRLVLAIPDFPTAVAADTAPRLPVLEALLQRGRRVVFTSPGWRHWVLERAGVRVAGDLPVAGVIAGRPGHFAVATPLNLLAGLEHVHLDPEGPPLLAPDEWALLADGFNEAFGGDGTQLTVEAGTALLSLPRAMTATTHDPEPLAGQDAGRWLPAGPDGGWLRRLMTEAQMWLHGHPLQAAREARGLRAANALWLWGIGSGEVTTPPRPLPALASVDAFLRCFWQRSGGPPPRQPTDLSAALGAGGAPVVATLSLSRLAPALVAALGVLEERWLRPLAEELAGGGISRADLLLGNAWAALRPVDRLRFWRRAKPWQAALS